MGCARECVDAALVDPNERARSATLGEHESSALEMLEMMRDGRLAHLERVDDLMHGHRLGVRREQIEDLDAGRVSQALEPARIQLRQRTIDNHRSSIVIDYYQVGKR